MYANVLPTQITIPRLHISKQLKQCHLQPPPPRNTLVKSSGGGSRDTTLGREDGSDDPRVPPPPPPLQSTKPPPDRLEPRYPRGSKSRRRRQQQEARTKREVASTSKKWEEMTLTEKAIELYVGDKGLLFWLNKFAYASIFIIIGGWILFRFVGPWLNLYQLDTPPLSPKSLFKGS